jgi:hypothetical protein
MAEITRRKFAVGIVVLLLLGVFLPPNINGVRFRDQLAGSLSNALGRAVRIGQVKYRVFPRPGFDVYDLQVMDDPAFSAEPLLTCGKVNADLRLTSLWHGRLEIANLKLSDDSSPASLNLVYSKGHWNLESLLLRVEQVPTAPTARRSAEQRSRFPYIEATSGRINLKVGAEKTPFTVTNTDFAFWLASEDVWHLRMEGRPIRTDKNLNDTGLIKLEGDLRRSRALRDMPVKIEINWDKAQLGQFSNLVAGQDRGWRGGLSANLQLSGTPANLHINGNADLDGFRRYDINRNTMPHLHARCQGDYIRESMDMKCDMPLDPGGVLLTAKWASASPRDYDLSVVATRVPLSTLATMVRHARSKLPDDLTATGDLNAAFGFHSRNGIRNWHGTGMTSAFQLRTSVSEKPFPVSPVRFHMGPVETGASFSNKKSKQKELPASTSDSLTIDTFSIQLGPSTTLDVQGTADATTYWVGAKGMVPLERLLVLGNATGFPSEIKDTTASAVVDLNIAGSWANFAPPKVRGTAHLQNLAAWIPGIKDRLILTEADAQISEIELVLAHINGQFEHTPITFTGTVNNSWTCAGAPPCPIEFDLHSDSLTISDLTSLLGSADKGWKFPFFSGSSSKLPDFRANGTFTANQLTAAQLPLEKFSAHVEFTDKALLVSRIAARLGGGSVDGEWRSEWSGATPHFAVSGKLTAVATDRIISSGPDFALATSWINGRTDAKYSFHFDGASMDDMLNSAAGHLEYVVANGSSRLLVLDGGKPLHFQSLQGAMDLEKQTLKILPSKFKADTRIYDLSGTVSLADKQARLKLNSNSSRWEITGALDKPEIAGPPASSATTAAKTTH